MSLVTTTALCLRKLDFSETSQILTLLTDKLGIVGAIAKGAKRSKSNIGGALDVCCLYDVVLYDRAKRDVLSILAQAQLLEFYPELREHYAGFRAAEAVRELLLAVEIGPGDGRAALLLAVRALREASLPGDEVRALARFAYSLLRALGFEPVFTHCVVTGREPSGKVDVAFSVNEMGLLAPPHDANRRDLLRITPGTLAALRALALDEAGRGIGVDAWRRAFSLCAWLVARLGGRQLKVAPRFDPRQAL